MPEFEELDLRAMETSASYEAVSVDSCRVTRRTRDGQLFVELFLPGSEGAHQYYVGPIRPSTHV